MLALAVGKAAPPTAPIMLYDDLCIFGTGDLAQTEPKEYAFSVFLVLVKVAEVDVAVWVDFNTESITLVVQKTALVNSAVLINSHT